MLSERFVNVRRGLIAAILLLGIVPAVSAQSISDARRVEFTPSPDHSAVDPNSGAALVTNYTLAVYVAGGATPVSTANLGKPALDVDGMIRLDFVALLTTPLSNGVVYESIVSAVGPGGTSASTRSNTFAFSAPCAPTILPASSNLTTSAAATGSVGVTAGTGCTWAATSNAPSWITITSGASGVGNGTVNYSVSANTGTTPRTGTLTVAGNTFTVTQAGAPCTFTIAPTSSNLTSSVATTGTVTVTAGTGCSWTATSGAAWITISAGASGSGNGSVSYSVAANTGTTPRTGTLTIAGQAFTVTQAGAPCTFTIAPTSSNLTSSVATTGTVTVTAGTGCSWTAASNDSWITISAGTSGSGNGTVSYSVAANTGTTSRNGTLTIGGQTFTVTQAGAPCTFTIAPTSSTLTSAVATTGTVTVTAGTGCSWTATSGATWITISAGASGTGNGNVSYSVAANTGTTSRTGALTIGGQTFNVTQPAAPCTFTIAPTLSDLTSSVATTGTVTVTAGTGCGWTATSNAAWLTISAGASGNGNGTVSYSVAANTGTTSRTGTLTIAGQTFTVTQAGSPCTFTISPTTSNLPSSLAGSGSVTVTAGAGCSWTAVSNDAWITIGAGASGTGNGSVSYSVAANTGTTARTGTLTIGGQTFTVTQPGAPCTFTISPTSSNLTSSIATTGTINVIGAAGCSWTATSNATWMTISAGASGTGNGTVSYSVAANTGTTSRTGTLTVGGQTFTVTQSGSPCSVTIAPTGNNLPSSLGASGSVTVTAGTGCGWTAFSNDAWITVGAGASGTGNGSVSYGVAANLGTTSRTGTLTIGGQTFTVTQPGAPCTFTISPTSSNLTSSIATTGTINVIGAAGCSWTATSNASWITISAGASGTGNGTVSYSVAANNGTASRTGTLTIGGQTFTVTQSGLPCLVTISPTSRTLASSIGASGSISVTAGSGCSWTAVSNDVSWLTIGVGATGTGNGTVSYGVTANTGAARTGTLTIGGQTFTITQPGGPCTFSLAPTAVTASPSGSTGTITVTTQSSCTWTSSSTAAWVTVTGSGTGSGSASYSVQANTGNTSRSAAITIGGVSVTVSQAAGTAAPPAAPSNLRVIK